MGKPFEQELEKLFDTFKWAITQSIDEEKKTFSNNLNKPLFIIGSGGSLSACYYAALLHQQMGVIAKAITPLETFYSKEAIRNANLLFISASGKNNDIIYGFESAIENGAANIFNICMKKNSKLAGISKKYTVSKTFEFEIPTGKDGFLASNSLVAFFTILFKLYGNDIDAAYSIKTDNNYLNKLKLFIDSITSEHTYTVMYGGWGQPVAIDIESKFTEAALGNVLLTDYRNFGHGRHHWFAKRGSKSAIVAIITPTEKELALKTLAILPKNIPVLIIESNNNTPLASIELLIKSFDLSNYIGKKIGIDPGRPGVPEFGRKLYNLKYRNLYKASSNEISPQIQNAILKKTNSQSFADLKEDEITYWLKAYKTFITMLSKAKFGSIVFDYDGTLCSSDNRYQGMEPELEIELVKILKQGFIVAIVTGRGQSVRKDLQKTIPKQYWKNVIIGYYNGSDIGSLENDSLPDTVSDPPAELLTINKILKKHHFLTKVDLQLRPNQLTIEVNEKKYWSQVRRTILQLVKKSGINDVQILESSHSIDIIYKPTTSKINILSHCRKKANKLKLALDCLCIGDKGQWPGNDYLLLTTPYSLSVDEVSSLADSCWNLCNSGIKNVQGTIEYLRRLSPNDNSLTINIK